MNKITKITCWIILGVGVCVPALGQDTTAPQAEQVEDLTALDGFLEGVLLIPRIANGIVTGDWSLGITRPGNPTGSFSIARIVGYPVGGMLALIIVGLVASFVAFVQRLTDSIGVPKE